MTGPRSAVIALSGVVVALVTNLLGAPAVISLILAFLTGVAVGAALIKTDHSSS